MIFVLSAGRSGSAWLCAYFAALGLRVRHEGYPVITECDVMSDTSWMWNRGSLINRLKQRNQPGITDTVILLDRPRDQIERSVERLIGKKDWDRNFEAWETLKNEIWNKGLTQILRAGFKIQYEDMFDPKFPTTMRHILSSSRFPRDIHEIQRVWEFYKHLRITNKTSEQETIESYGYGVGN